jgi:hypothetical protein
VNATESQYHKDPAEATGVSTAGRAGVPKLWKGRYFEWRNFICRGKDRAQPGGGKHAIYRVQFQAPGPAFQKPGTI